MQIISSITEIKKELQKQRQMSKTIAFVPTMGSLHDGHLSLVKQAQDNADIVVVSIFVNKAQFNNADDYNNYPRDEKADIYLLKKAGVNYVFLPSEEEMLGNNLSFKVKVENLANCLCGSTREGHFDGVALILLKFFNIIKPDFAAFGQKDFQQLAIVKKLAQDFNLDIEIIAGQTIRQESGLALSSRNKRLQTEDLIGAAKIYEFLEEIKQEIVMSPKKVDNIIEDKKKEILKYFEKIDYLEVRDEQNLELVKNFDNKIKTRIFIAVYLKKIRLIDNISLNF